MSLPGYRERRLWEEVRTEFKGRFHVTRNFETLISDSRSSKLSAPQQFFPYEETKLASVYGTLTVPRAHHIKRSHYAMIYLPVGQLSQRCHFAVR